MKSEVRGSKTGYVRPGAAPPWRTGGRLRALEVWRLMLGAGALGAYATLPDRNTGDLVTESDWQIVVDNFEFLHGPPGARVYHDANQSIASATWTVLSFNQERYDTDSMHDTVTNNSRLTCQTAGQYLIAANVEFAGVGSGSERNVRLVLNGVSVIAVEKGGRDGGGGVDQAHQVATVYELAVNDYVEVEVYQDSGGSLNVQAVGNYSPEFMMQWIGAGS